MARALYIDRFSSLDDLSKRDQRDPDIVLSRLRLVGRVSCFEMSECSALRGTIEKLKRDGKIKFTDMGYPWHGVVVTEPEAK